MRSSAVARRYARALFGLCESLQDAAGMSEQLAAFARAIRDNPDLNDVMVNPVFATERAEVVRRVIESAGMDPLAMRAILFLIERDRIRQLDEIVEALTQHIEAASGKVRAEVVSATELPKDRYQRIKAALERITGRTIEMQISIDPELIGGVLARVGSKVYDGSIRTQLRRFNASLAKES